MAKTTYLEAIRQGLMEEMPCEECAGKRLCPEALAVTVGDASIDAVLEMSLEETQTHHA